MQNKLFTQNPNRVVGQRWNGYEVSTKADKRFSALVATMPDGRTIEMHYQCDIKGYDPGGTNWRAGKGKPPKVSMTHDELYTRYVDLWRVWAALHPTEMRELRCKVHQAGNVISDRFATTRISQANALADILNETAVKLQIYTCSIANSHKVIPELLLDITVRSASGDGRAFTPTWDMVLSYKNGTLSEDGYKKAYDALMRESYRNSQAVWNRLLARDKVVLMCYCKPGAFCHRLLLTDMLRRNWGASYCGEI